MFKELFTEAKLKYIDLGNNLGIRIDPGKMELQMKGKRDPYGSVITLPNEFDDKADLLDSINILFDDAETYLGTKLDKKIKKKLSKELEYLLSDYIEGGD